MFAIHALDPSFNPSFSSFLLNQLAAQDDPLVSLDRETVVNVEVGSESYVERQSRDGDAGESFIEQSSQHSSVHNAVVTTQWSSQMNNDANFFAAIGIEDKWGYNNLVLTTQRLNRIWVLAKIETEYGIV